MIEIDALDSYDAVYPLWQGLSRRYKGGELALDWKIHDHIWTRFHAEKGAKLKIVVASEAGECVGILPFAKWPREEEDWTFGEDAIISREYFCPPSRIHALIPHLPPHASTDLSCFYQPENVSAFLPRPGCVADLKASEEEYLLSLGPKRRAEYLKTLKMNEDVEVVVERSVREDIVAELRARYIEFWMLKNQRNAKSDAADSGEKIAMDFALFRRAAEIGKLVALHFFLGGKLVAANFAVLRERDRVDDYLCLRDTDRTYAKRRLGILAIIRNMQVCRTLGVRYYDLSDFRAGYKDVFINTELCYWLPSFPGSAPFSTPALQPRRSPTAAPDSGGGA